MNKHPRIQNVHTVWFVVVALLLVVDRVSKYMAVHRAPNDVDVLIPRLLEIHFVPNPNILYVFALPVWLTVIVVLMIMGLLVYICRQVFAEGSVVAGWGYIAILGGAISNVIDRVWYGIVIDFFQVPGWSVFNIADLMIVGGALIICVDLWLLDNDEQEDLVTTVEE